jgi:hypothetical protein
MMAPDLIETIARVQEELAAQIEILDRDGGVYALRYLESFGQPKRVNPPEAPLGMSPHIRRMIREQVADELAARRVHQRDMVAASLIADDGRAHHHDVYRRRTASA